jgi:hypothetical protein
MKKIAIVTIAAATLALLSAPAGAQQRGENANILGEKADKAQLEAQEKRRNQEELDRAYKSSLQRTGGGGAPVTLDPWANARAPSPPKK